MDSNNMITPDQEPSSQQSALKKGEPEICPAHLAHACFPHAKKLSLKKL